MMEVTEPGYCKGDICNRKECKGIIAEHETDSCCSCHINPPCDYCTTAREYCPVCGWEGRDEQEESERIQSSAITKEQREAWDRRNKEWSDRRNAFYKKFHSKAGAEQLEIRGESHTHFTEIKRGVFPKGTETRESVLPRIVGTFGGRFNWFDETTFEYIAYTD